MRWISTKLGEILKLKWVASEEGFPKIERMRHPLEHAAAPRGTSRATLDVPGDPSVPQGRSVCVSGVTLDVLGDPSVPQGRSVCVVGRPGVGVGSVLRTSEEGFPKTERAHLGNH